MKNNKLLRERNPTLWAFLAIPKLIVESKIPPGGKINQSKLAEQLEISRTPVIKALHKLETNGLVDNIPQKGFYVHQLTVKELLNLYALREALENMIIEDITYTITQDEIKQLESVFASFQNGVAKNEKDNYSKADQKFHYMLRDFCRNGFARKVDNSFQVLSRTLVAGLVREPNETLPEHMELIAALKAKDVQTARKLALEHIGKSKTILQETVDKLHQLGMDPGRLPVQDAANKLMK